MTDDVELERRRKHVLRDVTWRASLVAGHMLRVIAGAGHPSSLPQLCFDLGKTIENMPPGTLVWQVTEAIEKALSGALRSTQDNFDHAVRNIEQASLRIVAARILEQQVQVTRRENDLFQAIGQLDRAREAIRNQYQEELTVSRPAPAPKRRRRPVVIKAPEPAAKAPPPPVSSAAEEDIDPSTWHTTADYMRLRRAQLLGQRGGDHDKG